MALPELAGGLSPDADRRILVVTGLAAEARILTAPGVVALSAPPDALPGRLADLDREAGSFSAVVSFGLAGGLDPRLKAGTLVIAKGVEFAGGTFQTDAALAAKLLERLENDAIAVEGGLIAARGVPVMTRAAKQALALETNAVAVDTESHLAGAFAARHARPFLVIRAICDAADTDLPPLAIRAVAADGSLDLRAIAAELLHEPRQLALLPRTAIGGAKAMRTLSRVRRRLGSRLGL